MKPTSPKTSYTLNPSLPSLPSPCWQLQLQFDQNTPPPPRQYFTTYDKPSWAPLMFYGHCPLLLGYRRYCFHTYLDRSAPKKNAVKSSILSLSTLALYTFHYAFHFLSRPPSGVFRRPTEKLLNARHDETQTLAKSSHLRPLVDPSILHPSIP